METATKLLDPWDNMHVIWCPRIFSGNYIDKKLAKRDCVSSKFYYPIDGVKFTMWFATKYACDMFMWYSPKSPLYHLECPWTQGKEGYHQEVFPTNVN